MFPCKRCVPAVFTMGRQELISVTDEAARRGDSSFWPKLLFCNANRRLGLRPLDVSGALSR